MTAIRKPLPREIEDGYELFKATPDGIVRWVRSTRPTPDPADVAAYVARQHDAGRLTDRDVAEVKRQLLEIAAA
jgi:mono/diheme cytochrome c family protein